MFNGHADGYMSVITLLYLPYTAALIKWPPIGEAKTPHFPLQLSWLMSSMLILDNIFSIDQAQKIVDQLHLKFPTTKDCHLVSGWMLKWW